MEKKSINNNLKIRHPLFLLMRFKNAVSLYYDENIINKKRENNLAVKILLFEFLLKK